MACFLAGCVLFSRPEQTRTCVVPPSTTMPDADLLARFRTCLRYQQAKSWQKPLVDPRRFVANQLRKRGWPASAAGSLGTTRTFHLPEFTVVQGELVSQELVSYSLFEPELT